MRWNLSSQEREPKEGAAGQRPKESSPEASDHPCRVQRHLKSEDDGGSRRQTGAEPGGCSGRAALRRGQCDILGFLGGVTYVSFPLTQ
jgi:hypothetical protein